MSGRVFPFLGRGVSCEGLDGEERGQVALSGWVGELVQFHYIHPNISSSRSPRHVDSSPMIPTKLHTEP